MNREDIQIISKHSNLTIERIDGLLKDRIYPDFKSWKRFLQLLFISLGIGFTVSGIIFFFAYNWADLHKFVKIGLIETLIISALGIVLFSNLHLNIKNIILTGASILVGVLFAVFGQIYQTGANAYDFFLGWTLFISIWVIISNFPPLWLVFLILINTTFILYTEQVASGWSEIFILTILFIINASTLAATHLLPYIKKGFKAPSWFTHVLCITAITFSTIGICIGIIDKHEASFFALLIITIIAYAIGLIFGYKSKSSFYLSIIPFSVIIIISTLLIKISNDASMFFILSIFIIVSVTLLIKGLLNIQKKWWNEK